METIKLTNLLSSLYLCKTVIGNTHHRRPESAVAVADFVSSLSLSPTMAQLRHQKLCDLARKLRNLHRIIREINLLRILSSFLFLVFLSIFSDDGSRFVCKNPASILVAQSLRFLLSLQSL